MTFLSQQRKIPIKSKKTIEIYNQNLDEMLVRFKLSHCSDLNNFSTKELKFLFDLFVEKLAEKGVDSKGNITEDGAMMDDIVLKINSIILS